MYDSEWYKWCARLVQEARQVICPYATGQRARQHCDNRKTLVISDIWKVDHGRDPERERSQPCSERETMGTALDEKGRGDRKNPENSRL